MNQDQILAILFEMAIVIGAEDRLKPLLTKTLQKLLYHTSFPAGGIFLNSYDEPDNQTKFRLEATIGDINLAEKENQCITLPDSIAKGKSEILTESTLINQVIPSSKYKYMLRLPIDTSGLILLLSPSLPRKELPLTEIFQPVMGILSNAINLCRRNEKFIEKEAFRQSEEKYKSLIEKVRAGIVVHNSDTRITMANPSAQSILGLTEDQLLGKTAVDPDWHFTREDQSRMPVEEYPANVVVRTRKPLRDFVAGIHRPHHKNIIWVLVNGDPVFDSEGNLIQIVITFVDISIRRKALEEVRSLNSELEQRVQERTSQLEIANKDLEAFAYSVSHDLRAPLRHINGFAQLLSEESHDNLSKDSLHFLEVILGSVEKMNRLIEDLLSFSRMGRKEFITTEIDLNTVIKEIITEMEPDTAGRNIKWEIAVLPRVKGDATLVRQALYNLIANAVKFSRNKETAVIEIGSTEGKKEHIIFIKDNGVGFDMGKAEKLFGVFQRLHSEEDFEGTGIGLANVKRIISRHNGRIWAESKPDKGACFFISLPE